MLAVENVATGHLTVLSDRKVGPAGNDPATLRL